MGPVASQGAYLVCDVATMVFHPSIPHPTAPNPVRQAGKLGAVVFQFHLSFVPGAANLAYLLSCRRWSCLLARCALPSLLSPLLACSSAQPPPRFPLQPASRV